MLPLQRPMPTINLGARHRLLQVLDWHGLSPVRLYDLLDPELLDPQDLLDDNRFYRALHLPAALDILTYILGVHPAWLANGEGPVRPVLEYRSLSELWEATTQLDVLPSALYRHTAADLHPLSIGHSPLHLWFKPHSGTPQFMLVEHTRYDLRDGRILTTPVVRYLSPALYQDTPDGRSFPQDLSDLDALIRHGWIQQVERVPARAWDALVEGQLHPAAVRVTRAELPSIWTSYPRAQPTVPVRPASEWRMLYALLERWRETGELL